MSLSTFSGHVANLVAILRAAGSARSSSIDELAAGTDPVEGSALAQALLARLAEQARLTVVTTHYPELKEWASATDGVANAATGSTRRRTRRSTASRSAGRVFARAADRRAARSRRRASSPTPARRVAPERLRIQELLAEAEAAERAAATSAPRPRRSGSRRPSCAEPCQRARGELEAEIAAVRASAAARARTCRRRGAARPRGGARGAGGAARGDPGRRGATASRGGDPAARERDRRLGAASERAATRRAGDQGARRAAAADRAACGRRSGRGAVARRPRHDRGDRGRRGRGGRAGRAPASRAARAAASVRVRAAARRSAGAGRRRRPRRRGDELDVRGQRAQEAREAVRSFVDDAALAGPPDVRVVHGRGTARFAPPSATSSTGIRSSSAARATPPTAPPSPICRLGLLDDLRGVELVRQRLEHAEPRLGHVEEALDRDRLEPGRARRGPRGRGRRPCGRRRARRARALAPRPEHARRLARPPRR